MNALKELLRHPSDGSLSTAKDAIDPSFEGQSQSRSSCAKDNLSECSLPKQPSEMLSSHECIPPVARPQSVLQPKSTPLEPAPSGESLANTNEENGDAISLPSEARVNEDEIVLKSEMAEVTAETEVLRNKVKELKKSINDLRIEKERLSSSIADRQKQWDHTVAAKELEIGQLKEIISQVSASLGRVRTVYTAYCFRAAFVF